jgi:hypothetical protein
MATSGIGQSLIGNSNARAALGGKTTTKQVVTLQHTNEVSDLPAMPRLLEVPPPQ